MGNNNSYGCNLCQEGKWLCIFLTYICDANCSFCASPSRDDVIFSAFGNNPAEIVRYIKRSGFKGISFSGGECFLVFDRLVEWLSYFKKHLPDIYYWVYTNGKSADRRKLQELALLGLDEIRYNIAATGYDSSEILDKLTFSATLFKNVTVEIPSIHGDHDKLVTVLPQLDKIGVKYLNLHEYILTPSDPYTGKANAGRFVFNGNIEEKYDTLSRENTARIIAFCKQKGLNLGVNYCSMLTKENQMLQRRRAMSAMLVDKHERITYDGYLETYFLSPDKLTISKLPSLFNSRKSYERMRKYMVHPKLFEGKAIKADGNCFRLYFLPPMAINEKRILYRSEIMEEN